MEFQYSNRSQKTKVDSGGFPPNRSEFLLFGSTLKISNENDFKQSSIYIWILNSVSSAYSSDLRHKNSTRQIQNGSSEILIPRFNLIFHFQGDHRDSLFLMHAHPSIFVISTLLIRLENELY